MKSSSMKVQLICTLALLCSLQVAALDKWMFEYCQEFAPKEAGVLAPVFLHSKAVHGTRMVQEIQSSKKKLEVSFMGGDNLSGTLNFKADISVAVPSAGLAISGVAASDNINVIVPPGETVKPGKTFKAGQFSLAADSIFTDGVYSFFGCALWSPSDRAYVVKKLNLEMFDSKMDCADDATMPICQQIIGTVLIGGDMVTMETDYPDCGKYKEGSLEPFLVESNTYYGGDIVAARHLALNPQNGGSKTSYRLPVRMSGGVDMQFALEPLYVDVEVDFTSSSGSPQDEKFKVYPKGSLPAQNAAEVTLDLQERVLDSNSYYQFIGCALHKACEGAECQKNELHPNGFDPATTGQRGMLTDKRQPGAVVAVRYVTWRRIEAGIACDCSRCCRSGAFFGTINAKVGCMKRVNELRAATFYRVLGLKARIAQSQMKLAYMTTKVASKKCVEALAGYQNILPKTMFDQLPRDLPAATQSCALLTSRIIYLKEVVEQTSKQLAEDEHNLKMIDDCVNCNALSRQYYKLWNQPKYFVSQFLDEISPRRRREYRSFEGWDRTDGHMFAVCDVCTLNPDSEVEECINTATIDPDTPDIGKDTPRPVWIKDQTPVKDNLNRDVAPFLNEQNKITPPAPGYVLVPSPEKVVKDQKADFGDPKESIMDEKERVIKDAAPARDMYWGKGGRIRRPPKLRKFEATELGDSAEPTEKEKEVYDQKTKEVMDAIAGMNTKKFTPTY
eukprot:GILI01002000.1.p1 GENE.GILI01002000.1~~GILI01002000.1.p1  ORF type:complete len:730 (-),score=243.70 GILI01002000.1:294-2483(-)